MVELGYLTPPPPLFRPKLLHIWVSFMNYCWSPVFWCNNDGTLLSHPTPSPIPPYIASCLSILWVPVEVPYFDVTMVELCYLTPPPLAPYIASHLCQFCELLLKSVFWCYNGITSLSPFRPTSYLCQFYEFPYFDILQKFALTPHPPPPPPPSPYVTSLLCQFY